VIRVKDLAQAQLTEVIMKAKLREEKQRQQNTEGAEEPTRVDHDLELATRTSQELGSITPADLAGVIEDPERISPVDIATSSRRQMKKKVEVCIVPRLNLRDTPARQARASSGVSRRRPWDGISGVLARVVEKPS
jgi:hypothetical protein